jgi:hypothetical protein
MSVEMFQASVPVFARYLRQLSAMVVLAQAHAGKRSIDPDRLLQARLSPSMYPFAKQVEIAANFAVRACAPLAQVEPLPELRLADGFEPLLEHVRRVQSFLETLSPAQMQGSETRAIESQAGLETLSLQGQDFLLLYALPNFFFHVTTAYAILRHMGVGLGKSDFDGFHVYAPSPAAQP